MTAPRPAPTSFRTNLERLGLTDDIVRKVIVRGETERDSVSPDDAPNRAGMSAYFERVLAIRELLLPLGWTADNTKNLCTVVSPCGRHAVAVVSGDRFTGVRHDIRPQPQYPRGNATAYAVNRAQLDMFEAEPKGDPECERRLWFLLVHRPAGGSEVRAELSLPDAISEAGTVTVWTERNLLEPINLTENVAIDADIDESDGEEGFDVEVTRKP